MEPAPLPRQDPLPRRDRPAPQPLRPVVAPPKDPRRNSAIWWVLGVTGAVGLALGIWAMGTGGGGPTIGTPAVRTALVERGSLERTLRVGGTLSAKRYSSIRAPRLNGPRDAGKSSLVLMNLAEAGTRVSAGAEVARFELKWLEDHIDDVGSRLAQTEAASECTRAEILLARETEKRAADTASSELAKSELDLRTAPVRSDIEAQILELAVEQARAQADQLKSEYVLQQSAHDAEMAAAKLGVLEEQVHLNRHVGDLSEMAVKTRVGGLIVMESIYKGGGAFEQVQEGDQVYPGTLFMRVVDLSEMQLDADVSQTDVQQLRIGQRCRVHLDAYPDMTVEGQIERIGAMAASGGGSGRFRRGGTRSYVRTVPVTIRLVGADERIIPDLSASADVVLGPSEEGVLVPREAVHADSGQDTVLIREGNGIIRRSIELGDHNDTHVVVRSGVEPGEEVVLGGAVQEDSAS